ncbi:hypothetical protein V2J09_003104 [Rumex salicifolius]
MDFGIKLGVLKPYSSLIPLASRAVLKDIPSLPTADRCTCTPAAVPTLPFSYHPGIMEDPMEVLKGLHITSLDEEESEQSDVDVYDINDDDDDDEVCIPVTLGFVEKPEKPWALLRQLFPSKAGSTPAWLDPINLPSGRSFICDFCEEPLQFLLQVYAPISEKEYSFHRVLYVFTCMSMTCLLRDQHEQWKREPQKPLRSVKVWRCQLPRTNQFYSSNPPKYDGSDRPLGIGAPLCTWCGTWKGDKVCSSCKHARYCSEKHQAINWRSGHKLKCRQITATSSPCSMSSKEIQEVASTSLWPEFEIKIEDECESDVEIPQGQVVETGKLDLDESEGVDEDKISWATFQERIGRAPEQVIRDSGARPLWPMSSGRPSKTDIPKCSYCGGERNFEFQILPQLLYYFGVQNETNSLDWASIAIYTCVDSCEASAAYKEEFAWFSIAVDDFLAHTLVGDNPQENGQQSHNGPHNRPHPPRFRFIGARIAAIMVRKVAMTEAAPKRAATTTANSGQLSWKMRPAKRAQNPSIRNTTMGPTCCLESKAESWWNPMRAPPSRVISHFPSSAPLKNWSIGAGNLYRTLAGGSTSAPGECCGERRKELEAGRSVDVNMSGRK